MVATVVRHSIQFALVQTFCCKPLQCRGPFPTITTGRPLYVHPVGKPSLKARMFSSVECRKCGIESLACAQAHVVHFFIHHVRVINKGRCRCRQHRRQGVFPVVLFPRLVASREKFCCSGHRHWARQGQKKREEKTTHMSVQFAEHEEEAHSHLSPH